MIDDPRYHGRKTLLSKLTICTRFQQLSKHGIESMLGHFPSVCIVLVQFEVNHRISNIASRTPLINLLSSFRPELIHDRTGIVSSLLPLSWDVPEPGKYIDWWIRTGFNCFKPLREYTNEQLHLKYMTERVDMPCP